MLDELRRRVRVAIELATNAGANDAWATASRSRSVELDYRDDAIEKVREATSRGLSLELWVDGRYSTHSTTDLREPSLRQFIPEAVALTRALEQDPFREITDPALFVDRPTDDLDLVDPEVRAIDVAARVAWCEAMAASARAHDKIISATVSVSHGHSLAAVASSNGFAGDRERSSVWCGGKATLDDGERRPEGYFYAGGRHLEEVPDRTQIGASILREAARRLGMEQGPTTRTTMIVEPRVAGRLIGRLLGSANARAFSQERSFWRGKIGERAVSEQLTIVDDPLKPRGLGSRLFDGEGISARRIPILEAGALRNLYVDTYYGKKIEMAPTTRSRSNLVIGLGDKSLDELIVEAGRAVLVTSWLGGNHDRTTGDFSLGLRGHLVENGRVGGPIGEMNVTGNLLELFSRLVAIGNDPWPYGTTNAPTLVFESVQFSGA